MKLLNASNNLTTWLAFFCLLAGAAALAYGGVFVRESELPPTASAVYRVLLAAPIFFIFAKFGSSKKRSNLLSKHTKKFVLIGIVFAGNLSLYHWSIHYTTLANSNLLANLAPVFVIIYMYLFMNHRMNYFFYYACAGVLFGLVLLLSARSDLNVTYNLGNAYGVASGAFYGVYLLTLSQVRSLGSTNVIMGWSSLGTLLVLLPLAVFLGESLVPSTLGGWGTLLMLALISHVAGQGLIAFALAHLSPAVSSLTLVLQVVFSAFFGWMLIDEIPLPMEFIGGAIIVSGVLIGKHYGSLSSTKTAK